MKPTDVSEAVALQQAISLLKHAHRIVIFTGAGMSAESGIPTFRDALTGYWSKFDPMDLATPEGFAVDPERVLGWYAERRAVAKACEPHQGYEAVVALAKLKQLTVITQNVDRLHQRSGQINVIELHGNILEERCNNCSLIDVEAPETEMPYQRFCQACGGPLRPAVVWFGENLPDEALATAVHELQACDLAIVIGTSAEVYPAARLPSLVKSHGGKLIVINVESTSHSDVADVFLLGAASYYIPKLVDGISGRKF